MMNLSKLNIQDRNQITLKYADTKKQKRKFRPISINNQFVKLMKTKLNDEEGMSIPNF
jgi:hypothetical protein